MNRICYIDNFSQPNSNGYWLKAFQSLGETINIDVFPLRRNKNWPSLPKIVKTFEPTHVHLGGSVKHGSTVPIGFVRWIREEFPNCRVTCFYGDAAWKYDFYDLLEPYVDNIFTSSIGWVKNEKYIFMPCPAPHENYRRWSDRKEYDLVFIGNNYNQERLDSLLSLHKQYNLVVFGDRWPKLMNCPGRLPFSRYSDVCSKAHIVLADPAGPVCKYSNFQQCLKKDPDKKYMKGMCRAYDCSAYEELIGYQSNRMFNTLIAGTVYLVPYVTKLEEIVTENEVVWYRDDRERNKLIKKLLTDPDLCKRIAQAGQKKVLENYTYEKCASQFLATINVLRLRKATDKDAARYCKLRNGENTYKWFFSEEKFDLKKTIAWLNALPNTDEVYMVELDGKTVGTCSLYNIDWKKKSAEVGRIIVAEGQRGKGLGARILDRITDMATSKGLRLLYANIKKDNISSQRAFEKAGYVQQSETFYWKAL